MPVPPFGPIEACVLVLDDVREREALVDLVVRCAERVLRHRNEAGEQALCVGGRVRIRRVELELADGRDVDDRHADVFPRLERDDVGDLVDVELGVVQDVELPEELRLREDVDVACTQDVRLHRADVRTPHEGVVLEAVDRRL